MPFGEVRLVAPVNILLEAPAVFVVSIAPIDVSALQVANILLNVVPASVARFPKLVRESHSSKHDVKSTPAEKLAAIEKLVMLSQSYQAESKSVPLETSRFGNPVNPVQPYHAKPKLVPAPTSINGNDVRPVQPRHATRKSVQALTSSPELIDVISTQSRHALLTVSAALIFRPGNDVRPESRHAFVKSVPLETSADDEKLVISPQSCHADSKSRQRPRSAAGKLVSFVQPCQA